MILITGTVVVAAADRDAMLALGRTQTENSRSEAGNISYDFLENPESPNVFTFVERWRDQAAVQTHFGMSYSQDFVRGVRAIAMNETEIQMHDVSRVTTLVPGRSAQA